MPWFALPPLLTSACTDHTFISKRAAQLSHWRASICQRLRSWVVQSVKRRKRLSRLLWVQYLQVRHHIRRWGVHVALTRTLHVTAGSDTVSIFCQPHTILLLIPTIPDCVCHVLSLSCPRPLPTHAETSPGRTRSRSRKRPITDVR